MGTEYFKTHHLVWSDSMKTLIMIGSITSIIISLTYIIQSIFEADSLKERFLILIFSLNPADAIDLKISLFYLGILGILTSIFLF